MLLLDFFKLFASFSSMFVIFLFDFLKLLIKEVELEMGTNKTNLKKENKDERIISPDVETI